MKSLTQMSFEAILRIIFVFTICTVPHFECFELFFVFILNTIAITIDHVGSSDKIARRDYIDIEPWVALSYQVVKRDGLGGR